MLQGKMTDPNVTNDVRFHCEAVRRIPPRYSLHPVPCCVYCANNSALPRALSRMPYLPCASLSHAGVGLQTEDTDPDDMAAACGMNEVCLYAALKHWRQGG